MKHELKIIMTFNTEDMEHDQATPIWNHSIRVSVDDMLIGCIQDMKISANCKEEAPQLEFTFPDFENLDYDHETYQKTYPLNPPRDYPMPFAKEVGLHIKNLQLAPNVKIKLKGIDDGVAPTVVLDEVGTDGHIDIIPMKRRHSI